MPPVHPQALPNFEKAFIHPDKFRRYALDLANEKGSHKARVFKSALGFTLENVAALEAELLRWLPTVAAVARPATDYGVSYVVDIPVSGPAGTAMVRTGWHIDTDSDIPRLVTAYVIGG